MHNGFCRYTGEQVGIETGDVTKMETFEAYYEAFRKQFRYLERENILERQREGIEIAKSEGKYKGRKPVEIDEAKFKAVCARWRAGEITATAAMQEVGLKPNTFYRRVKEMGL